MTERELLEIIEGTIRREEGKRFFDSKDARGLAKIFLSFMKANIKDLVEIDYNSLLQHLDVMVKEGYTETDMATVICREVPIKWKEKNV